LACIKPPIVSAVGKIAIIGVTRPSFAAGPTASTPSGAPAPPSSPRSGTREAGRARASAAAGRAEQAVRDAASMSLEQIGVAKKDAQRGLAEARASAPPSEITRLESAVKDLQRAESRKRGELAAAARHPREVVDATSGWLADYLDRTGGRREVVEIDLGDLTYLFDSTTAPTEREATNRVVAVYGRSGESHGDRDKSRMSGHPNPNHVDRGHLVARAIGGGYDLNLIPQDPKLNQGHSEPGKVWRELERDLESRLGTAFFVRPTYGDTSDYPTHLEFGVQLESGEWRVEHFDNRPEAEA
jgi:hypothetical protein